MKQCNKCKKELTKTDFHKDLDKQDGLATICKSCKHEYAHSEIGMYNQYKSRCKKYKREFTISLEFFTTERHKTCKYCSGKDAGGLDREDNNIGYTPENAVPCCFTCNWMKRNLTVDEFTNHITKILFKFIHKNRS